MRIKYLFLLALISTTPSFAALEATHTYNATINDGTPIAIQTSTLTTEAPAAPVPVVAAPVAVTRTTTLPETVVPATVAPAAPTAVASAPATLVAPATAEPKVTILIQGATAPQQQQASAAVPAPTEDKSHFDLVPPQHAGEVNARVKYVYEILRRYGRAYDYRVLSSRELRDILNGLEQQKN